MIMFIRLFLEEIPFTQYQKQMDRRLVGAEQAIAWLPEML